MHVCWFSSVANNDETDVQNLVRWDVDETIAHELLDI
jgi:hypothetical protein